MDWGKMHVYNYLHLQKAKYKRETGFDTSTLICPKLTLVFESG